MILHPHQRPFAYAGIGSSSYYDTDGDIGAQGPFGVEMWTRIYNWLGFAKITPAIWNKASTIEKLKWTAGGVAFKLLKPLGILGAGYAGFVAFDELILEPSASNIVMILTLLGLALVAYIGFWIVKQFKKVL